MQPAQRVILAEYFTTEDATLLFIVREDFTEPVVKEIELSFKEIRQFVTANFGTTPQGKNKVRGLRVDEWQQRFGQLIEPLLPYAEEGDTIWFVPHDFLHYVPLHALHVEGAYLIERNPICYTPSASVMKFCQAKRKGRHEKALVLGDSRSNLIFSYEEALIVAEQFATTPYLQQRATKTLVKERLALEGASLDILHFSCHGHFNTDQALKSSIVLAPEQSSTTDVPDDNGRWNLSAEEIFRLSMPADLVTLSACETGVNEHKPGDELIGLTRSLIYAGAASVLVSLWAVYDLSAALLMERFYELLCQPAMMSNGHPITKAEALRQAQIFVMKLTAADVLAHCNRRLAQLTGDDHVERFLCYRLGMAQAHIAAKDWRAAMALLAEILDMLPQQYTRLSELIENRLFLLGRCAREKVNFGVNLFGAIEHWAPFILVGDWR